MNSPGPAALFGGGPPDPHTSLKAGIPRCMTQQSRASHLLSITVRILVALLGIVILATIIPHKDPWRMMNIVRVINPPLFIDIHPLGTEWSFRISEAVAVLIFVLGFSIPLITVSSFRRALASLKSNKPAFFSAILALEIFLFTLIPVSNDIIHDYKSVFLFTLFGSLGSFYLCLGSAPFIRLLLHSEAVKRQLTNFYLFGRRIVFESPLPFFLTGIFLAGLGLTILISFTVFEAIPHVQDSVAQYFQGKIFSTGHLTVPSPPQREFFNYMHMINNGQWYSQYPPGHPFLLMLGILAGIPWIINPLFGSVTLILLYFLGSELYGVKIGRLSALLGLLSPFLLFMSSEYMNHTTAMFFFILFVLMFLKAIRTGKWSYGAVAGIGLGMVASIRPYSAAALALFFLLYGLVQIIKRPKELWASAAAFAALLGIFGGLLMGYNYLTNGNPFLFGFEVLYGPNVRPGFGHAAWGVPHNAFRGLLQTMNNLNGMNKHLFEWPAPSLLFVFVLFTTASRNKWDYLLMGTFVAVVAAYFLYWFQDLCFGPRFLYEPAALLIILSARGIERVPMLLREILGYQYSAHRIRVGTFLLLVSFIVVGFTANIPAHLRHYSDSYWDVNRDVLNGLEAKGITRGLILTRTNFGGVLPANPPLLDGDLIFARDFGLVDSVLVKTFPDYDAYIAVGSDIQPYSSAELGSGQPSSNR